MDSSYKFITINDLKVIVRKNNTNIMDVLRPLHTSFLREIREEWKINCIEKGFGEPESPLNTDSIIILGSDGPLQVGMLLLRYSNYFRSKKVAPLSNVSALYCRKIREALQALRFKNRVILLMTITQIICIS